MSERERRLAENEAAFRTLNERLESHLRVVTDGDEWVEVFCECANIDCGERLQLTPQEYRDVRGDPRQFVVVPGHAERDAEIVVLSTGRYEVVRKIGEAGEVAEKLAEAPNS